MDKLRLTVISSPKVIHWGMQISLKLRRTDEREQLNSISNSNGRLRTISGSVLPLTFPLEDPFPARMWSSILCFLLPFSALAFPFWLSWLSFSSFRLITIIIITDCSLFGGTKLCKLECGFCNWIYFMRACCHPEGALIWIVKRFPPLEVVASGLVTRSCIYK